MNLNLGSHHQASRSTKSRLEGIAWKELETTGDKLKGSGGLKEHGEEAKETEDSQMRLPNLCLITSVTSTLTQVHSLLHLSLAV